MSTDERLSAQRTSGPNGAPQASDRPPVRCRAVRPGARLPVRMTGGASGWDLHACLAEPLELGVGERALIPTGLVLAIPPGFEGSVRARSGLALRAGIGVLNGPGTIDSDYRGEVGVLLINLGREPFIIQDGDRVAQIVFQAVPAGEVEWGEVGDDTDRGAGGFGHTGTGERNPR